MSQASSSSDTDQPKELMSAVSFSELMSEMGPQDHSIINQCLKSAEWVFSACSAHYDIWLGKVIFDCMFVFAFTLQFTHPI